jgi:hypothetical protein
VSEPKTCKDCREATLVSNVGGTLCDRHAVVDALETERDALRAALDILYRPHPNGRRYLPVQLFKDDYSRLDKIIALLNPKEGKG